MKNGFSKECYDEWFSNGGLCELSNVQLVSNFIEKDCQDPNLLCQLFFCIVFVSLKDETDRNFNGGKRQHNPGNSVFVGSVFSTRLDDYIFPRARYRFAVDTIFDLYLKVFLTSVIHSLNIEFSTIEKQYQRGLLGIICIDVAIVRSPY